MRRKNQSLSRKNSSSSRPAKRGGIGILGEDCRFLANFRQQNREIPVQAKKLLLLFVCNCKHGLPDGFEGGCIDGCE
ncbi:MAG: hypothetical protein NTW31_11450, partial [Bacteroidetes bacterium]|nr:hypothetical protein [Bacteroidota bacterium]